MAVRLHKVSGSEDDPATGSTGWDDALRPSGRIMGGRIADKLGSRMGLRLHSERLLSEPAAVALFDTLQAGSAIESRSR